MNIELHSRADLFRKLKAGAYLTMTGHDWYPNGRLIGQRRRVLRVLTERAALETVQPDGSVVESWMDIPRASDMQILSEDTFRVRLDDSGECWMTYRLEVQ